MTEWVQLANTAGVAVAVLAVVGVAVWKFGKLLAFKVFGDETHKGYLDILYEAECQRWNAMADRVDKQQTLCNDHGTTLVSHDRQMRAAALEACAMCRAIAKQDLPASSELVSRHCDEIERIIGEA